MATYQARPHPTDGNGRHDDRYMTDAEIAAELDLKAVKGDTALTLAEAIDGFNTAIEGRAVVTIDTEAPADPNNGDIWIDNTTGYVAYAWDAVAVDWVEIVAGVDAADLALKADQVDLDDATVQIDLVKTRVFDVRDYGADDANTATQNRVAFQATADAIHANGGGTFYVPKGHTFPINFRDGFYGSSFKISVFLYGSDVLVTGGGKVLLTEGHVNGFVIFANTPAVITPANVDSSGDWWLDHAYMVPADGGALYPTYTMTAAALGDSSVTLATPAEAANFAIGDVIHPRTGQTTTHAGEGQPDSFIDEITGISGGVLSLKRGVPKPMVQEYFPDSGRDNPTVPGSTAWPALFGVQNITDVAVRNIRFIDVEFEVDQVAGMGYAIAVGNVLGFEVAYCVINGKNCVLQAGGPYRNAQFHHNEQYINLTVQADAFFTGDRGCGDVSVDHNTLVSFGTQVCTLPFNEGTYNVVIDHNTERNRAHASANHGIQVRSRGYNVTITNNDVDYQSSSTGEPINTDSDIDGLTVDGNRTQGLPCSISGSRVRIGKHDGGMTPNVAVTSAVQSLDFTYDYTWTTETEVIVGYIPARSYVSFVDLEIIVPFNGTTPRFYLGDDDLGSAFINAADVSGAAWTHPAISRNAEKGYYQNSTGAVDGMLAVYAYPEQGGSTAGQAKVVLHWAHSQDIPGV